MLAGAAKIWSAVGGLACGTLGSGDPYMHASRVAKVFRIQQFADMSNMAVQPRIITRTSKASHTVP